MNSCAGEPGSAARAAETFVNALLWAQADGVCGAEYASAPRSARPAQRVPHRDLPTGWAPSMSRCPSCGRAVLPGLAPDPAAPVGGGAEHGSGDLLPARGRTRRMDKLVRTLGITGLSKSQVSEMAKDLDEQVEQFRTRPLTEGPYTFVAADALTMKVREGGGWSRSRSWSPTVVNADGYHEVLGSHGHTESGAAGWRSFRDLVARGLIGVALVTSDAHTGWSTPSG